MSQSDSAAKLYDREPGEVDLASFHKCPTCDKLFFGFMDLYDHMARHRDELTDLACDRETISGG